MTDPHDYWGDGSRRLANELVRMGRSERASPAARTRAEQVLLANAAVSGVATAKVGAWVASLKWLGVSALLVCAGSGLWQIVSSRRGEVERVPRVISAPARVAQNPQGISAVDSAVVTQPTPLASILPTRDAAQHGVSPAVVANAPPARASAAAVGPDTDLRLTRELQAVRAARADLTREAPTQALATLDSVPGGFQVLSLEANLVRVDALRATGQREAARALSEQLLRQHPDGPYTQRLRALAASSAQSVVR